MIKFGKIFAFYIILICFSFILTDYWQHFHKLQRKNIYISCHFEANFHDVFDRNWSIFLRKLHDLIWVMYGF